MIEIIQSGIKANLPDKIINIILRLLNNVQNYEMICMFLFGLTRKVCVRLKNKMN